MRRRSIPQAGAERLCPRGGGENTNRRNILRDKTLSSLVHMTFFGKSAVDNRLSSAVLTDLLQRDSDAGALSVASPSGLHSFLVEKRLVPEPPVVMLKHNLTVFICLIPELV